MAEVGRAIWRRDGGRTRAPSPAEMKPLQYVGRVSWCVDCRATEDARDSGEIRVPSSWAPQQAVPGSARCAAHLRAARAPRRGRARGSE